MADFNEFDDERYTKTTVEGIFTFRQLDIKWATAYDLFVDDRPLGEIDKKNGGWQAFKLVGIDEPLMTEDGRYNNGWIDEKFKTRKEAAEALWA